MAVKRAINLTLSLAVTVACFAWTFRNADWPALKAALTSANYLWLIPHFLLLTLIHIARTVRWGNLLAGLERVGFRALNESSAIGFMLLVALPFRLGEFARPILISQRSGIRKSSATASIAFERVADGLFIAVLLRVLLFFVPLPAASERGLRDIYLGSNLMFLVFGGVFVFLLFSAWQHDRAVRFIRATTGWLSRGLSEKASGIVDGFVGALKQLPPRRDLLWFAVLSVVFWGINGWTMVVVSKAFDCGGGTLAGCQPLVLDFWQGMIIVCVLVVAMMIPAAPGAAGTFQLMVMLALGLFVPRSVVNSTGLAFANVVWATSILQQLSFGLYYLVRSQTSLKDITGRLSDEARTGT